MTTLAFIQARMSSVRFPGKVLAPFRGRPLIAQVIEQVAQALPFQQIVVLTSEAESDTPLACYVEHLGARVFRGPLEDVFTRFQLALRAHPCDWFFRICADSPQLNSALLSAMLPQTADEVDLITNVYPRSFPHGHSTELLRAATFAQIKAEALSAAEREHVTKFYYAHADQFRIINFENTDAAYGQLNFAVDTLDDLRRLENYTGAFTQPFTPPLKVTRVMP